MAKRRGATAQRRAGKKRSKALHMTNPGGRSRYCQRPVDPHRSTYNAKAVERHIRLLEEARFTPEQIHRHMTGQAKVIEGSWSPVPPTRKAA
jgi:hypothetical protein